MHKIRSNTGYDVFLFELSFKVDAITYWHRPEYATFISYSVSIWLTFIVLKAL